MLLLGALGHSFSSLPRTVPFYLIFLPWTSIWVLTSLELLQLVLLWLVQRVSFSACKHTCPLGMELTGPKAGTALAIPSKNSPEWLYWLIFYPGVVEGSGSLINLGSTPTLTILWYVNSLDLSQHVCAEHLLCACHHSPCWVLETQRGTDWNPVINEWFSEVTNSDEYNTMWWILWDQIRMPLITVVVINKSELPFII